MATIQDDLHLLSDIESALTDPLLRGALAELRGRMERGQTPTSSEAKPQLTPEQQKAVIGLATMFLAVHRTGEILNTKTGRSQSAREYANSVFRICGINGTFRDPPAPRDIGKLRVVDAKTKETMHGRVSRDLEAATRRHPAKAVHAWLERGYWRPVGGESAGTLEVLVKERRAPKAKRGDRE